MIIFCRNPKQNEIVCWARSPGDHALNIEQFPILNFNDDEALGTGLGTKTSGWVILIKFCIRNRL